ncbi:cytochrome c oxidase assembly protein [Oceanobacillus saliphilus]|uniref:cytochrome c oxidase assembly protein n=1 Tax=Oceanobacillus saliphilus TaxID=2925834 RepID=UPI00201D773C|nr:cytochrome c oxidase assembly protein [Oceanobacillus saliphilus]
MLEIILDEFHFSTLWNGGILLFSMFGAIIYFFLLPSSKRHPLWKSILFLAGLIIIFIAIGSPLNVTGRIKFSSHIIQLVLLLLVAPPLIIVGFKTEILNRIQSVSVIKRVFDQLRNPITATILFQGFLYGYHIPIVFNFARIDLYLNYFFLLALFISALLFWIPILSRKQLAKGRKWKYAMLNVLLLTPFSIILLMADEGIYLIYSDMNLFISALALCLPDLTDVPPEFFASLLPFDPVHEQRLGATIFLISQVIIVQGVTWVSIKCKKYKS